MTREEAIEELKGCIIAEERGKDGKTNGNITCELTKDTLDMAIKALEQEPTTKNDLGVDCIDRTRAIERLKLNFPISQGADNSRDRHRYMQALADIQAIRELPSVTPQEPIIDKIIAEIGELYSYVEFDEDIKTSFNMVRLEEVQRVIDKYKAESEGKE